jgi:CII-binding regulator of phage lambda lysogenization HflD
MTESEELDLIHEVERHEGDLDQLQKQIAELKAQVVALDHARNKMGEAMTQLYAFCEDIFNLIIRVAGIPRNEGFDEWRRKIWNQLYAFRDFLGLKKPRG